MSAARQRLAQLRSLRTRLDNEITILNDQLVNGTPGRRRRSRHRQPPCGTEAGYQWHRHRQHQRCAPCWKAHSAHVTAYKARKKTLEPKTAVRDSTTREVA